MPLKKKRKKPGLPPCVILKRGEWYVRVVFPTKLRDKKGRRVYAQMSRKCDPQTEERADEIVKFLRASHARLEIVRSGDAILNDYMRQFLESKKHAVSSQTYGYYSYLFETDLRGSPLGMTAIDEIKAINIQQLYNRLISKGASPVRIRKLNAFLSMALRQAVLWDLIPKNPCDGVMRPKITRYESPAMSKIETHNFLKICRENDRFIIFEFALETGLRPQETLALRWSDVDLNNRKITIRQAVTKDFDKKNIKVGKPKTEASKRTVRISESLSHRLARQMDIITKWEELLAEAIARPLSLKHTKAKGTNYRRRQAAKKTAIMIMQNLKTFDLVFPGKHGALIADGNLNRRDFKDALRLAGIDPKKYAFKTLRHTCATLLLADGAHIKAVSRRLGHSSINMTLNAYTHVLPEQDDQLTEAWDNLFE